MPIHSLEVTDFRNLHSVRIEPSPSINWIVGLNGAGKSSLLEAIYFVGTGKSFRTQVPRQYIRRDARKCTVFVSLSSLSEGELLPLGLGLERDVAGGIVARSNGENVKRLSDLARHFPVVTLLPDSLQLIDGEPAIRREFLDWTMFHVEHSFDYLDVYRNYSRVLAQRNQILKSAGGFRQAAVLRELPAWDEQFVFWGERLGQLRAEFVARMFGDSFGRMTLSGDFDPGDPNSGEASYDIDRLAFHFARGWNADSSLAVALAEALDRDIERGSTTVGPHRFDLRVQYDGVLVRDFFSRGQKKHLVSLCKIRQAELFREHHAPGEVIFLFDDVFSELDKTHARSVISRLRELAVQVFATSVEAPDGKGFSLDIHDKMFHVEHGSINQLTAPSHRELNNNDAR